MEASSREAAKQVDEGAEESRRLATLKALGLPDSARGHPVLQSICDSIAELLSVSTTSALLTCLSYILALKPQAVPFVATGAQSVYAAAYCRICGSAISSRALLQSSA